MSIPAELEDLTAAWQVDAIDEIGLQRLEALLLADPAARLYFARQCREDVVLRQLSRISVAAVTPGPETQRLMQQGSVAGQPSGSGRQRASASPNRRVGAGSGTARFRKAGRVHRLRSRSGPGQGLVLSLVAAGLIVVAVLVAVASSPSPVPAPRQVVHAPVQRPQPAPVRVATLREVNGAVEHQQDGTLVAARNGQALSSGDRLRLGLASSAVVMLEDGTRFELVGGSEVQTVADAFGFTLVLDAGVANARVARQAPDRVVLIRTPEGTVRVIGTDYQVATAAQRSRIAVHSGLVEVRAHGGGSLQVAAAQVAVIEGGQVRYEEEQQPQVTVLLPPVEPALPPVPEPQAVSGGIISFSLLDAVANTDVPGYAPLPEGVTIDRKALELQALSLRANVDGPVAAVRFWIDGSPSRFLEKIPPFTLLGDQDSDYLPWRPEPGSYLIEAQAYRDEHGREPLGERFKQRIPVR